MAESHSGNRRFPFIALALLLAPGLVVAASVGAHAATGIDGPIDLGTATTFSVLGATAVTNTGPSVIAADLGVSPGSSITGFPPGIIGGVFHSADAVAIQAQTDVTTATNTGASLTPTTSGLANLTGLSLTPGVYSGGALSIDAAGALTLAGDAASVWVFQASSTLTTGAASQIILTGGASICNVFWLVGSSATLGTGSSFAGTIMAAQSITATTGATISGRLLASAGAVTLDTNTIVAPTGCAPPGSTTESPVITSGAPADSTEGTPYIHTVTATGTPGSTFAVTAGTLPDGLALDGTTGDISGTPTTPGDVSVTITATNGQAPDSSATYTMTTLPAAAPVPAAPILPETGSASSPLGIVAALLLAGGLLCLGMPFLRRRTLTPRQ
jgi:hypothetical protein